jgi:Rieske Fe-S protein
VGGEDHKVGEADDTTAPFERLEAYVRVRFGRDVAATDFRWSGQIVESADGLPYVGRNSMSYDVYVATGYGGNGITQGTLAATVIADEITRVANPYRELLDATRIKPLASAGAVLAENLDYPKHMVADRLSRAGGEAELAAIAPGEGRVLSLGGERLAVYRNANGQLGALSPVCTHLGCLVHWNTTEKSWDCPCHGSRFDPHGRVLNGRRSRRWRRSRSRASTSANPRRRRSTTFTSTPRRTENPFAPAPVLYRRAHEIRGLVEGHQRRGKPPDQDGGPQGVLRGQRLRDVATYIQSGQVVFTATARPAEIVRRLERRFWRRSTAGPA